MKSLALSMLAIASMAAMSSCSSENDPVDEVIAGNQEKVEIKLSAGVVEVGTKAIIEGTTPTFNANVIRFDATTTPTEQNWKSVQTEITANVTSGVVGFGVTQYYTAANNAYFIGYSTAGATALSSGVIPYTIDGSQDIICTTVTDAGSNSTPITPTLEFGHKLALIKITVKAENEGASNYWGNLTSIEIKNMPTSLDLDLNKGTIAANTTPNNKNITFTEGSVVDKIPTSNEDAGNAMVLAVENPELLIKTANFPDGVNVTTDLKAIASKKNTITLNFKANEISVTSATVEAWGDDGGTSNKDVE